MRHRTIALIGLVATAVLAGCGAKSPHAPYAGVAADAAPGAAPAPLAPPGNAPALPSQVAIAGDKSADAIAAGAPEAPGSEQYTDYGVNPVVDPAVDPLSTFAIDVDTASYSIARSKIQSGALPPMSAVRAEEFINYFDYGYDGPDGALPFAVHLDAAPSPYHAKHHLLRVGVQAKRVSHRDRKPVHLVYLVDTSGSMNSPDKLGLAKQSLKLLTKQLKAGDTVALCTYAGDTRIVLEPTGSNEQSTILNAIDDLTSGGGTAMSSGIEMAYQLAEKTLVKGHINRVIVLSDGDANIGRTSHEQILERIAHFKDKGITLSTIGFGRGNYKDTMMEQLANKGDGNYAYIDGAEESNRVFGEQLDGMLEVVARDVKIQVQFDPRVVKSYRLIGYENRDVADRDFRNDRVDAGEIGAGHNVTALYDIVLKDQPAAGRSPVVVRLRHKAPTGSDEARETSFTLDRAGIAASFDSASQSFRFATAVAGFAEILRQSPHARSYDLDTVAGIAKRAANGSREQQELVRLVGRAAQLAPKSGNAAIMAK